MLVIAPDETAERLVPIYNWLVVGRHCLGVDERHRLLSTSRPSPGCTLELRLDFGPDQAWLTDLSTNGTRLNGQRIDDPYRSRSSPVT